MRGQVVETRPSGKWFTRKDKQDFQRTCPGDLSLQFKPVSISHMKILLIFFQ